MRPRVRSLLVAAIAAAVFAIPVHAALTIEPITWNIIGLDSNDPATGPNRFPVGARVCSDVATTNVSVQFVWDSANPFIDLRPGSLSTVVLPSIGAGGCADAYFEVEVDRDPAAFDTARRYHITASDLSGTVSTPTPRELYVEHLISQSRNSISSILYGPDALSLTAVPPGGSMALVVGQTYAIQLQGGTATQGYNQFEAFINFPNTIFQILDVETTYSADDSPYVDNPSDMLYANACLWENDPNSPNYRSCVGGDFKAGGSNVVTTYTIRIVSGGGTSESLNSLLYDFSGSSFHYNADYGVGARIANIIDPSLATIAKNFSPDPASVNGISTLTFILGNPNGGPLTGYSFVDNLPANLEVAATPNATTSGCGTPTLTAVAGSTSITFSNGTVAANSTCTISVNVTPTATGTLDNTTNNLFVEGVDTGKTASDSLTVNNEPPPPSPVCGSALAAWTFPAGFNTTTPAPSSGSGSAAIGAGLTPLSSTNSDTTADGTLSWGTNGNVTPGATLVTANDEYFEFAVDTTGLSSISLTFDALKKTPNGPAGLAVYYGTSNARPESGTQAFNDANALPAQNDWVSFGPFAFNSGLNPSGTTYVRIYTFNSGNTNSGSDLNLDNVAFTGCVTPVRPTIAKSFSPDPIAVGGVSTLTFTLTSTNAFALTGATFSDALPSGLQVAATPAAASTCGGTWAPAAGATTLSFSGGTIPAGGSCTVAVNITATTAGPHTNVAGFLSTTETGQSTGSIASDTLTAIAPPVIAKQFAPSPIFAGGVSTLTFTITNPNPDQPLVSVAFNDTFPAAPGAMTVAPVPNASTSGCGAPAFAPAAGAGSITFSGATIAPGGTCTVQVDVTAPVAGTYNNTSGNVSHVINATTVNGNTASDSLVVEAPVPAITLLKQIGESPTGPWLSYEAVAPPGPVYYRFTLENTGDVPLSDPTITDPDIDVSSCNASFSGMTLPVAVAANENHIVTCVVGPVPSTAGTHPNTATATGTFSGTPVDSPDSSATYASAGLTLDKTATQSSFSSAGQTLNYSYLVTNGGFATLEGPVTVTDDKATVTCPSLTTVGDLDHFFDPGESITCTASYVVLAGDVATGSVTNTATAEVDGFTSNPDSVTVPAATSVNVSLDKTLDTAGPYSPGQSISYTITVANAGPGTATGIDVTDTPTNLTITGVSGACATLPCVIASLASGANAVINVTATITAAGAFDNSATAMPDEIDVDPSNNTDNTGNGGTTGAPSVDVSIVKTLTTAGPYSAGQSIAYTLTVANAGPSTATGIDVTDTPANLTITGVSGACATLPCVIASLASGANTVINVTATINAAGAFDNVATATPDESDTNPSDNTDDTGNGGTAGPAADVSIVKTLTTAGPYSAGQSIAYTLTVANSGPSTATGIDVTDTPANLTITSVSGACAAFPCVIASLASGANTVINVTATITAAGAFDNVATANADEPDPDSSDNTDDDGNGGTAGPAADVSIVKTLTTAGPYSAGQSIAYTLTVANAGPSTATGIDVTDTPANLTITSVSGACGALPCVIASLASGANTVINVTTTITAAGAFDNIATANADEPDPDSSDNTDDTGNGGTAGPAADVSIVKTLTTAGPYSAGQSIDYTLTVANAGPSTATGIDVTDTPTNLTITSVSGACAAFPCVIASLASGANTVINVTATINAAGAFDNAATTNADEPDPDSSDNTDDDGNGGTAGSSADVSIVKTLTTAGPYSAGQSIDYTLTVANAGPSTATGIDVTDTPANLTITSVSGACAAFPCVIASLASGANTVINVTATITAAGAFDNVATANADEPDPDSSDNTDDDGNGGTADPSADVSIAKTLTTAGPYSAGQSIDYTLTVANAGPSTATGIDVTDTPANLTITSVSGACAAFPCVIASLASGANTVINVTATITAAGAFDNIATANADEPDPDSSDNTDDDGNGGTTGPSADVSIVKTLTTAGPYSAGQSIDYTLTVANAGPSTATGIDVTDSPTNLTITSVSGACGALPCVIASLASGANTVINVTATITAAGAFDNAATANADEPDPDSSDNTDDDGNGGTAGPAADVSIVKTLTTAGPYSAGQSIDYTLTVANAGPSTATGIDVTDTPTNLTITSVSGACGALPCVIASLASGANTVINVTATITAAGAFDNVATANADEPDPDPSDNTDDDGNGDTADPSADVSIVKTLTTIGPYSAGQSIDYTLTIANAGPSTATGIDVTDTPANLTITSVSGACGALPCVIASLASGANTVINVTTTITAAGAFDNVATANADEPDPDPSDNTDDDGNNGFTGASADVSIVKTLTTAGPYSPGQSVTYSIVVSNAGPSTATGIDVTDTPVNLTITSVSGACAAFPCVIPSLAVGASANITVTATIIAAGAFDNVATANADEPDPDPSDNTDDDGNAGVASLVDLQIVKTSSSPNVVVGQPFTFSLVVTNNGPDTATNVVVTDPLPATFALASSSTTQGTCSGTTTVTCNLGTMLNGASVTITLTGQATAVGPLANTATVDSDESEVVTTNNTSSVTPVASASPAGIPTASEWALILLALMLAAAGLVLTRHA